MTDGLCLGVHHIFIALLLVAMILTTIIGNILVILAVANYRRMRTFTNVLLVSLSSSDLMVGIMVTPLALIDLLHYHVWPFGWLVCRVWATSDVLLCTASILNLCVISLDRYAAITSPLRYTRTRSGRLAVGLIIAVWVVSLVICSPPWFIPKWDNSAGVSHSKSVVADEAESLLTSIPINSTAEYSQNAEAQFFCGYTKAPSYRIYSAMGSFFIPLAIMLSVYYRIFRVASQREEMFKYSATGQAHRGRSSKTMQVWYAKGSRNQPGELRPDTATSASSRIPFKYRRHTPPDQLQRGMTDTAIKNVPAVEVFDICSPDSSFHGDHGSRIKQQAKISLATSYDGEDQSDANSLRKNWDNSGYRSEGGCSDGNSVPLMQTSTISRVNSNDNNNDPSFLVANAKKYFDNTRPLRGSRERMVYQKERKALKTIGIVVLCFVACWLPFFVLYLVEAFLDEEWVANSVLPIFADLSLWLGYSNSALNPLIYTFYNQDFRRCFRDLINFGCMRREIRNTRMSVRRLHQIRL